MSSIVLLSDSLVDTIRSAASCIVNGGVVAFPTETYYGLAVDPFNEAALQRLFALKRRPSAKPILTLIQNQGQVSLLACSIPQNYQALMDQFWPGPLTLIFPARTDVSVILTGSSNTVGMRISSHPIAQFLVECCGKPVTATSANLSGFEPASCRDQVWRQFGDQVDMIIDGGDTRGGGGSTIVGTVDNRLTLVRSGVLPVAHLSVFGKLTA